MRLNSIAKLKKQRKNKNSGVTFCRFESSCIGMAHPVNKKERKLIERKKWFRRLYHLSGPTYRPIDEPQKFLCYKKQGKPCSCFLCIWDSKPEIKREKYRGSFVTNLLEIIDY
jgi:hypothetical protein